MWNKIYSLPFQVALDTYTRDFQYKMLNRILFTNSKLFKLKLVESPLCSFCDKNEETLEHLFVFCEHSKAFWKEISSWLHECGIETLPDLTDQINIMFGLFDVDNHFMLLNHIMLIAKQTIFLCRQKSISPSFIIFLAHLHFMKWEKLLQLLSWNNFILGSLVLTLLFIHLSMLSSNNFILFIYLFIYFILFFSPFSFLT